MVQIYWASADSVSFLSETPEAYWTDSDEPLTNPLPLFLKFIIQNSQTEFRFEGWYSDTRVVNKFLTFSGTQSFLIVTTKAHHYAPS
jgi:hypothetical protein